MVKIPGTAEGVPAIRQCLSEGININITLLFSVERYLEVADAYFRALERRLANHETVDRLASVASFFVSRIDAKVDPALDALPNALRGAAGVHRGRIAIANAKRAYGELERLCGEPRWQKLAAAGARRQRLLWASTSPKDPSFPDIYYVEALIGAGTIDTMTPECLRAYLERGQPAARIADDLDRARTELVQILELGVDLPHLLAELESEGVAKFAASFDKTLRAIEARRAVRPLEAH
jgi:transaldolase